jgi:ABC-2 type transport system permease protein
VFSAGIALILASCFVYFRDLNYLWSIATQLGFFAAPVVYQIDLLPTRLQTIVRLNPLTAFINSIRNIVYDLRFPELVDVLAAAAWSATALVVGVWTFSRLAPRFAEEL